MSWRPPTARQLDLLRFLAAATAAGRPPTLREMADHMEVVSLNSVIEQLVSLERRCLVQRVGGPSAARSRVPTVEGYLLAEVSPSGRLVPYADACAELGVEPNPAHLTAFAVVTPIGTWLLGEPISLES